MSDEKIITLAPEAAQAQSNGNDTYDDGHALTGKVARLPAEIREQLNQRLHDGQGAPQILPWLNALPVVREIMAAQFHGAEINAPNLTLWRQSGFRRWLRQKQTVSATQELYRHAVELNKAGGGQLAPAAASMASAKVLEFLESANAEQADAGDIAKCAAAASVLLKMEQNNSRIEIANKRLHQHDINLYLKRDKLQRDTVAIALRVLTDARAKEIEAAPIGYAEKIEILGIHLFGHLWVRRPVSAYKDEKSAEQKNDGNNQQDQAESAADSTRG